MKRIASPKALESTLENVPNYGMEEEKVKCYRTWEIILCKKVLTLGWRYLFSIWIFERNSSKPPYEEETNLWSIFSGFDVNIWKSFCWNDILNFSKERPLEEKRDLKATSHERSHKTIIYESKSSARRKDVSSNIPLHKKKNNVEKEKEKSLDDHFKFKQKMLQLR